MAKRNKHIKDQDELLKKQDNLFEWCAEDLFLLFVSEILIWFGFNEQWQKFGALLFIPAFLFMLSYGYFKKVYIRRFFAVRERLVAYIPLAFSLIFKAIQQK